MTDAAQLPRPMLALPRHASVCEMCEKPIPAYGPTTCQACEDMYEACLVAENDLRTQIAAATIPLIAEWVKKYGHLPHDELSCSLRCSVEAITVRGLPDIEPLMTVFDAAYDEQQAGGTEPAWMLDDALNGRR